MIISKEKLAVIIPENMYKAYNNDYSYCAEVLLEPFIKDCVNDVTQETILAYTKEKNMDETFYNFVKRQGLFLDMEDDIFNISLRTKYSTSYKDLAEVVKVYKTELDRAIWGVEKIKEGLAKDVKKKANFYLQDYKLSTELKEVGQEDYIIFYLVEFTNP